VYGYSPEHFSENQIARISVTPTVLMGWFPNQSSPNPSSVSVTPLIIKISLKEEFNFEHFIRGLPTKAMRYSPFIIFKRNVPFKSIPFRHHNLRIDE